MRRSEHDGVDDVDVHVAAAVAVGSVPHPLHHSDRCGRRDGYERGRGGKEEDHC